MFGESFLLRLLDRLLGGGLGKVGAWWRRRRPPIVLRCLPARGSRAEGVNYFVAVRNEGQTKVWDVAVRALHDGVEVARKGVGALGGETEEKAWLLIPAALCHPPKPGVGHVPRGRVEFEAMVRGRVVARCSRE